MKLKLCGWVGCDKLIPDTQYFCDYHRDISQERRKASAFASATRHANYNDPNWRRLSHAIKKEVGHCEQCGTNKGLQVHHRIPVRYAPELFLERNNLVVLCESCHRVVTAKEEHDRRRSKRLDR